VVVWRDQAEHAVLSPWPRATALWSWVGSSSGPGRLRTAAPDRWSRSWPRSWASLRVGDGDHDQDDEELHRGAVCRLNAGTSTPFQAPSVTSCPAPGADLGHGARPTLDTNAGPCARSGEEGHERCREWPPVVRDVRDPDDDRRRSATPWTQVRLGRPRGSCSGARLPKVGVSRWSTQRHGHDHQDDAEPKPGARPPANQTGRLCGRRHLRAEPLSVGDDARLVGRFEG
jgi:hypothetical protein